MKQMKFIMIMLCSIILLSGCNKKEEVKENTNINQEEVKEETKNENTTPPGTVNTMIESKKSAVKDSLYGYVDTIDKYIALAYLKNESSNIPADGTTCTITNKTTYNDECKALLNSITVSGSKPDSGSFKIGSYGVSEAKLVFDGYIAIYDGTNVSVVKE